MHDAPATLPHLYFILPLWLTVNAGILKWQSEPA
jgi:hypothetical protein